MTTNIDMTLWYYLPVNLFVIRSTRLTSRCVACVIDSTGIYVDGGKRNLLDDQFCGPAHQNGCDMTRNIPQPIWCIGPQKVYPRLWCFDAMALLRHVSCLSIVFLAFPSCSVTRFSLFFASVLLITVGRWKRTQFWSSKLAVIVELYDKPTLMVKVCPIFRQDVGICVFHECSTLLSPPFFSFSIFFIYWNLRAMMTNCKYTFASLILLPARLPRLHQTLLSLSLYFFPILPIFLLLYVSCFDLTFDDGSFSRCCDKLNFYRAILIFFAQDRRDERTPHERQDSETRLRKNISLPMSFRRNPLIRRVVFSISHTKKCDRRECISSHASIQQFRNSFRASVTKIRHKISCTKDESQKS